MVLNMHNLASKTERQLQRVETRDAKKSDYLKGFEISPKMDKNQENLIATGQALDEFELTQLQLYGIHIKDFQEVVVKAQERHALKLKI